MPNWVYNEVVFKTNKKEFKKISSVLVNNNGNLDFNNIIPMPSNIYRGDLGQEEIKKYGKNNWYDWSVKNWGTKWNACYCEKFEGGFYFETAWCFPEPVIIQLSKMFPTIEIIVNLDFECDGDSLGLLYKNGELLKEENHFICWYEEDGTIKEVA